ncbi:MAG: tetratricopeptide repeat protein [Pseudomonadota bacterium]
MSVVNTMLRELAERQQGAANSGPVPNGQTPSGQPNHGQSPTTASTAALGVVPAPARSALPWWFLSLLVLALLILIWRLWLSASHVPNDDNAAAPAQVPVSLPTPPPTTAASADTHLTTRTITVPVVAAPTASRGSEAETNAAVASPRADTMPALATGTDSTTAEPAAAASIGWELVHQEPASSDEWSGDFDTTEPEIRRSEPAATSATRSADTSNTPRTAPTVFERAPAQLSHAEQLEQLRLQARAALAAGDLATAGQAIDRGLQLQGEDSELHTLRLDWLALQSPEQAVQHARQQLQERPDRIPVRQWLGSHYLQQQQAPMALDVLQTQTPALTQSPDYHGVLALAEQQTGQHQAAARRYLQLTQLQPQHGRHWAGLALSQESLGQRAEAIRAWRLALRDAALPAALARFGQQRLQQLLASAPTSQVSP